MAMKSMFWQVVGVAGLAAADNIIAVADNAIADGPELQEEVRESGMSCLVVLPSTSFV
jgi:hypothetical protein